jgi:hypothetical protein
MRQLTGVLANLLFCALLVACGPANDLSVPTLGEPATAELPGLPKLDALRGSAVLVDNPIEGRGAWLQSSGALAEGSSLQLSPEPSPAYEWAVYAYAPQYPLVSLRAEVDAPQGGTWIALADYSTGRWQISGPYSGSAPLDFQIDDESNLSAGATFYCAVIACGADAQVDRLLIRTDEPDTQFPIAVLELSAGELNKDEVLTLDGSQSFDPDGAIVKYEWDSNGDGVFETDTGATDNLTINASPSGELELKLRVTDDLGAHALDSKVLLVHGVDPPVDPEVEDGLKVRWWPSMALVEGHPAICYCAGPIPGNDQLYYVRALDPLGLEWGEPVEIASTYASNTGYNKLMVVSGKPAICFYSNLLDKNLRYVRSLDTLGETWGEPVVLDSTDGQYSSMAIISGNPAVCYYDEFSGSYLRYRRALDSEGQSWDEMKTLTVAGEGQFCSLASIDGYPAIAYSDFDHLGLHYRRAEDPFGMEWGDPVDMSWPLPPKACYICLAEINGRPAISYNNHVEEGVSGQLCYLRANDAKGADWPDSAQILDSAGQAGEDSYLTIIDGFPAIAYFSDKPTSSLNYIRSTDPDGANWALPYVLDGDGETGECPSLLELEGAGAAIAYRRYEDKSLKYTVIY